MKTRRVIGQKIVRVDQVRWWNVRLGKMETTVHRIVLGNGLCLLPIGTETETETVGDVLLSEYRIKTDPSNGRENT